MIELLSEFVDELRKWGLPVSLTEHLDAARAVHHIPLEDREALRWSLAATLVKSSGHMDAFNAAFDVYFATGRQPDAELGGDGEQVGDGSEPTEGSLESLLAESLPGEGGANAAMSDEELAALLYQALLGGDDRLTKFVARRAVSRFAGMEPGRPVGGTYYLYRTLRNLDLDGVLERLVAGARPSRSKGAPQAEDDQDAVPSTLAERLVRDEYKVRIERLRKAIEDEIRSRLVQDRGSEALARSIRRPLPEDLDVMHATREELAALQRALQPLSRKLAVRLARRRRHGRKGPLDVRSTLRHSLSTGGVPVEPKFRRPRPSKPEIFVIADISGSVASFARFTLHLVHAISSQFSRVRSFAFVDGIDEVTHLFEESDDPAIAVHRINSQADVVWIDGHSNYGNVLATFSRRWGDEVTSRTSVLVLGDARNNYHPTESWVLADLQKRARHVYWLNPEPRHYWNTGDSAMADYEPFCDTVVECRTLSQLEQFVGDMS